MSRYAQMFQRLDQRAEGAFGAFLMLGDPDLATSETLLDALVEGGADMIEVGIPFSDPVADGPVIQAAATRALSAGTSVDDCFGLIARFRSRHPAVPVGILTYANLLAARGRARFCADAAKAGADSLLVADVPAREAPPWAADMRDAGLDPVLIAASNTPEPVLRDIAALGSGYTYCLTRAGVTGTERAARFDHGALLAALQAAGAARPVFGFGIGSPADVTAALDAGAAGVIVGSAIVRLVGDSPDPVAAVRDFVATMKAATTGRD
jgi:tryptophan synthase alpha chain